MMQTSWGEIPVRDAHAHLFSHSFFGALANQKGGTDVGALTQSLGWETPPVDNAELAARWVEELDRNGVAESVLMASVPGDEVAAADAVRAFPERFHGYFMLNPMADDALERARRAFEEFRLKGLCLFPAMLRFSVRDPRLTALYQLAAEVPGRVVFVHMGVLTVGVRKKLGLPSKFDMSLSNPVDLHRVALEHPETNFVLPHFGAGYFREALMLCDLAPNVYLDTSSSNSWTKYHLPRPTLADVFERALDVVGHERLLFGSDSSFFPRGWNRAVFEAQQEALSSLGVTSEQATAIFGGNLARLLPFALAVFISASMFSTVLLAVTLLPTNPQVTPSGLRKSF